MIFQNLKIFSRKWLPYFKVYDRYFNQFVAKNANILEIGIENGGSLKLWHEFFENANIYGIDINKDVKKLNLDFAASIDIGDQADNEFWKMYLEKNIKFDVIIDDGGHGMHQQLTSLIHLFPNLNEGGVYLIEDTHTSYWKEYGGGFRNPDSIIEIVKGLVEFLHITHLDKQCTAPELITKTFAGLSSVHFYDSIIVLEKNQNIPFIEARVPNTTVNIPY